MDHHPSASNENVPVDLDDFPSAYGSENNKLGVPTTVFTTPYDDLSTIAADTIGNTVHYWDDPSHPLYGKPPPRLEHVDEEEPSASGGSNSLPHSKLPPSLLHDGTITPTTTSDGQSYNFAAQQWKQKQESRKKKWLYIALVVGPLASAVFAATIVAIIFTGKQGDGQDQTSSNLALGNTSPNFAPVPTPTPVAAPIAAPISTSSGPQPQTPAPVPAPTEDLGNLITGTGKPTQIPTETPMTTQSPTFHPSEGPTRSPTLEPTKGPTLEPTKQVPAATKQPTPKATKSPTQPPTPKPTERPTQSPTPKPTLRPTQQPNPRPTLRPTQHPTPAPTARPTQNPTDKPTDEPTRSPTKRPTPRPTPAPVPTPSFTPVQQSFLALLQTVSSDSHNVILQDSSSPQYKAMDWVTSNDYYSYSGTRLIQRYALAVFAYGLGNLPYSGTGNAWLGTDDECTWLTASSPSDVCDSQGMYKRIDLRNMGLAGTLPNELSLLSNSLNWIFVPGNTLEGTIPTEYGQLTLMERFQLTNNLLDGSIPTELGLWVSSLTVFGIGRNGLTGRIPTELGMWQNIKTLGMERNALTGSVPDEWGTLGQMSLLEGLFLDDNALTGTVPPSLGNLASLKDINISSNDIFDTVDINHPICALSLTTFVVDCNDVTCSCCTDCY